MTTALTLCPPNGMKALPPARLPGALLRPWDFPGKSTGVGCHCLLLLPSLGETKLVPDIEKGFSPLSLGFSRQEHWSGLPSPSPMCESEVTPSNLHLFVALLFSLQSGIRFMQSLLKSLQSLILQATTLTVILYYSKGKYIT